MVGVALTTAVSPGRPLSRRSVGPAFAFAAACAVLAALLAMPGVGAATGTDASTGNFGYAWVDNLPLDYTEIRTTGTMPIATEDSSAAYMFPGGFSFRHYGSSYTSARVSDNGYIQLDSSSAAGSAAQQYTPVQFPNSNPPSRVLAPFWVDLTEACSPTSITPPAGTTQRTYIGVQSASAPYRDRMLVSEWDGMSLFGTAAECGGFNTFQLKLFEGTDILEFQYKQTNSVNNGKTVAGGGVITCHTVAVGMEDGAGSKGVHYKFLTAAPCTSANNLRYTNVGTRIFKNDINGADQTVTLVQDTTASFALEVSDDPMTYTLNTSPAQGTLTGFPAAGSTYYKKPANLSYKPAAGWCGTDSFQYTTNDLVDMPAKYTVTLKVTCNIVVNAAPVFTLMTGPDQTVAESAGLQTVFSFAGNLKPDAASSPTEAAQKLHFVLSAAPASWFSTLELTPTTPTAPPYTGAGALSYTPVPGKCGDNPATITVRLHDDGGTANGGQNVSAPQTFRIKVVCAGTPAPSPTQAADGDWDGDGWKDSAETIAGSDPRNRASTPNDLDADGVPNNPARDNCPTDANPTQTDSNRDGRGDVCQTRGSLGPDPDQDARPNESDNCPTQPNFSQDDADLDKVGDACDSDMDNDGFDNEAEVAAGSDPRRAASTPADIDGDGVANTQDNCAKPNADQRDGDRDGVGDACIATIPAGLNATAVYDGVRLLVRWSVAGEESLTTTAQLVDGSRILAQSPVAYGPGAHKAYLDASGLEVVSWRVVLTDPWDASVRLERSGDARVPPVPLATLPAVLRQPASAPEGDAVDVAYTLPAGTLQATLELRGARKYEVPLDLQPDGTWAATGHAPPAGTYLATVRYERQGTLLAFSAGQMEAVAQPQAAPPAVPVAPQQSWVAAHPGFASLGLLAGLAAVGLLALAATRLRRGKGGKPADGADATGPR